MITTATGRIITHVGVIDGGLSAEARRGYTSGATIFSLLKRLDLSISVLDLANHNFVQQLQALRSDVQVWLITALGEGAEDGLLQGCLETLDVPYVGSGVIGSAIFADKWKTKQVLQSMGIVVPPALHYIAERGGTLPAFESVVSYLELPFIVKPTNSGASLGIVKVCNKDKYCTLVPEILHEFPDILLEKYIAGCEFTVGVIQDGKNLRTLPVVHQINESTRSGLHDTESKLQAQYAFPTKHAPIERMQAIAQNIHAEYCRSLSRVDFIVSGDGKPYVLEINTLPGLLPFSAFPAACREAGIDERAMITMLLSSAFLAPLTPPSRFPFAADFS